MPAHRIVEAQALLAGGRSGIVDEHGTGFVSGRLALERAILEEDWPHRDFKLFTVIAEFTLCVATKEPGRLLPALMNRLEPIEFESYSLAELTEIARRADAAWGYRSRQAPPQDWRRSRRAYLE